MADIKMKEILQLHGRTLRELNKYVPGRIPQTVLSAVFESLSPYATVWLSAQLINELATLRRPDVLWSW